MKRYVSLLVVLAMIVTTFAGFSALAADESYVYVLSEQPAGSVEYHDATGTASEDGAYVSIKAESGDMWFALHSLKVPSEYKYMALKYAGSEANGSASNNHYVATDGGLGWGGTGSFTGPKYEFDNNWHLQIINIPEAFPGVGSANITDARWVLTSGETRFAYIGFFKTEADAQEYDAEYTANNKLEAIPLPEREEKIPSAKDAVPEYTFDFDNMEVGYDLFSPYNSGANKFRTKWTPVNAAGASFVVTEDHYAKLTGGFAEVKFDNRWKGGSDLSFDLLKLTQGNNFVGFFVRPGAEGSNPYYENDGVRPDSGNSTTGNTGVGFSFRPDEGIEIFVKYVDDAGKLQVAGYTFYDLFEGTTPSTEFHNYQVKDDDKGTLTFYIDGVKFAKVLYSNPAMTVSPKYSERYYQDAVITDGEGNELVTVENALISTQSTIAFGARAEGFSIDNIVFTQYVDDNEPDYTLPEEDVVHVSYDEIRPDGVSSPASVIQGGQMPHERVLASGTKTADLWGWVATTKTVKNYSYSVNGGEVVTKDSFYVAAEDAVISSALGFPGAQDAARYLITVPVTEGTQVVRAYVEFEDGTHELFYVTKIIVGEATEIVDAGDTYPNTTTPDPDEPDPDDPIDPKPPVDETAPQFKASSAEGVIGDTIVIELSLLNNPGISGFNLRINYDQNKLELVSYEDTRLLGNRITAGQTIKQYPYPQVWSDLENTNVNGVFGKLTFKIKDDTAAIGTTDITITILDVTECLGVGRFNTVTDKFIANNGVVTISDINCDHVFGDWEYADENNHKHTCTADCGRTYYEAHTWDAGKVTKNATCDAEGEKTYTCTVCGGTKTEKIAATGHNWGAWTVTKAPTCTEAGEETRTCANDASHKETRAAAATGHKWGEWTVTKAPTCTEAGEETRTCANDASHKETREAAALGHDWDEGEVTTEPTCTEAGEKTYSCTRCDETKTEEVPATGHSFTNYVPNTDATVDEDATEIAECDHGCGETDVRPIEGTKLPAEPEDPNKPGNPTTSDVSMWIVAIALLSVAGVVVVMYYKKRTEA